MRMLTQNVAASSRGTTHPHVWLTIFHIVTAGSFSFSLLERDHYSSCSGIDHVVTVNYGKFRTDT